MGLGWNPGGRRHVALGELDLTSGELTEWATPGDFWLWGDWSPDGTRAVAVKSSGSRQEAYILERDGHLVRVLPGARRAHSPRWTESGILLLTDAGDRDFLDLALVEPERPEDVARWVFAEDHDLEGFVVDNAGRRAALVLNQGIYDELRIVDLAAGETLERIDWSGGVAMHDHTGEQGYHLNWGADDRSLFVSWEHPDFPAEIQAWPGETRWTFVNTDEELAGLVKPVELT
ncbi:MAG TPA: hypothetical protein VIP52_05065 [Candidatus Dormibacteraeota bacterium]